MTPDTQFRLQQLESNINSALRLLNQYEGLLETEEDPARRLGYERKAARLRESAKAFKEEQELLARDPQAARHQPAFDMISRKIDELRVEVGGFHEEQSARDRRMLAAILERLDAQSEQIVRAVLVAADANQIEAEESRQLVLAVQQRLAEIAATAAGTDAIPAAAQVAGAIEDPSLDVKHKLKLSIPIVPLLLSYETEIGVGSGVNLRKLWDKVVAKAGGK